MDKSVQITSIIVVGVIVITLIGFMTFNSSSTSNTVTGNGQAVVDATPDLVGVYFTVQTEGDTSEEATDENSEIVEDLIINLLRVGLERKDIQTQNFNVYPNYRWLNNKRVENGYQATHSIRVELSTSQKDRIGEVIDAGAEAGAGIPYINFELSSELQNQYKSEALKLAAEDAKLNA